MARAEGAQRVFVCTCTGAVTSTVVGMVHLILEMLFVGDDSCRACITSELDGIAPAKSNPIIIIISSMSSSHDDESESVLHR